MVKHCLKGARTARGVVVIIDVFRASNTMLMLLSRGASSVIAVSTVREAFRLKKENPRHLLAGERKGIKLPGFDMGNSPHRASELALRGKGVILTTSAGTKAIERAREAERVFIGSFANARALTDMLRRMDPPLVTWLAAGTEGVSRAIEDDLCAVYLNGALEGSPPELEGLKARILTGEGASRLRRLGQEEDFPYCLSPDLFDFVPEVLRPAGRDEPLEVVRA